MLEKLYLTPGQWRHMLRWFLYSLLFLVALLFQSGILGRRGIFGLVPNLVASVIICVCMMEGPERGGLFALLTSTFWALSGADQGALQILFLTALPIVTGYLCRKIFTLNFLTCLISCVLILLLTQSTAFFLKCLFEKLPKELFLTRLLPGIPVSLLFQPLTYWLVKSIQKIGDPYETA